MISGSAHVLVFMRMFSRLHAFDADDVGTIHPRFLKTIGVEYAELTVDIPEEIMEISRSI
jgi:hypothetical protein